MTIRYRKKPIVVEAVRVGEILRHLTNAATGWKALPVWLRKAYDEGKVLFCATYVVVKTLEGEMEGGHGDWLIQGVQGEIYPIKDKIFRTTYEPVDA